MSAGEGFARRVTLTNLLSFSPLLKQATGTEEADEQSTDAANQSPETHPELAAAEALFRGKSIKTGVSYSRPRRGQSGKVGSPPGQGLGSSHATSPGSDEILLMRVRPRRTGTQLQISMTVHSSTFMQSAKEVVSAADGSRRPIGYDYVRRKDVRQKNTARFEAPELRGMGNPVALFKWVDADNRRGGPRRILQYRIFDADNSIKGKTILKKLEQGIAMPAITNLHQLSRTQTVLSRSDRKTAQWYRLDTARD